MLPFYDIYGFIWLWFLPDGSNFWQQSEKLWSKAKCCGYILLMRCLWGDWVEQIIMKHFSTSRLQYNLKIHWWQCSQYHLKRMTDNMSEFQSCTARYGPKQFTKTTYCNQFGNSVWLFIIRNFRTDLISFLLFINVHWTFYFYRHGIHI